MEKFEQSKEQNITEFGEGVVVIRNIEEVEGKISWIQDTSKSTQQDCVKQALNKNRFQIKKGGKIAIGPSKSGEVDMVGIYYYIPEGLENEEKEASK